MESVARLPGPPIPFAVTRVGQHGRMSGINGRQRPGFGIAVVDAQEHCRGPSGQLADQLEGARRRQSTACVGRQERRLLDDESVIDRAVGAKAVRGAPVEEIGKDCVPGSLDL